MFDDIIKAAKGDTGGEEKHEVQSHIDDALMDNSRVRISVIGAGGAGCNCINRLTKTGIKSAQTIAINTDGKHLHITDAHKKILVGKGITKGLGAGGDMSVAEKCADADAQMLRNEIGENELVFICAGMGGGTGGGIAPKLAEIAREQGAIVISIVTYPFALERVRLKKAQEGIRRLLPVSDTVVVIDNNRLTSYAPNLQIEKAFELVDSITVRAVRGIADTIMFPSLINVDYADVKSIMKDGGLSVISIGEGIGVDKVEHVVKDTLEHPLLDVDYEGAKGALIHLEGGMDLTLGEAIKIGEQMTGKFDDNASVKMGARINPDMRGSVRAHAIITGVKSRNMFGGAVKSSEDQDRDIEYL